MANSVTTHYTVNVSEAVRPWVSFYEVMFLNDFTTPTASVAVAAGGRLTVRRVCSTKSTVYFVADL